MGVRLLSVLVIWSVLSLLVPAICFADSMSGVGDLTITTLDSTAQQVLAANGVLGATQTDTTKIVSCTTDMDKAGLDSTKDVATLLTPSSTTQKLDDSVNKCFARIQDISAMFNLPTSLSLTQLFETILKQLIARLVDEVIMKICTAATSAWNAAVGNAVNTINSGINQSGVNTFGNFVNVQSTSGSSPPPPMSAPAMPASAIPGL